MSTSLGGKTEVSEDCFHFFGSGVQAVDRLLGRLDHEAVAAAAGLTERFKRGFQLVIDTVEAGLVDFEVGQDEFLL